MGCDIHLVLEKLTPDGKWVGIDTFKSHQCWPDNKWAVPIVRDRNYVRFANLAGVRATRCTTS